MAATPDNKQDTIVAKSGVQVTQAPAKQELIIANIIQTSVDRSKSTIGDYKRSVESAESVHYPMRASLYDLYTKCSIDGTYIGAWELKRIAKVLSKELKFKVNDKEVEELNDLIDSKSFRDFIRMRMMQKAWGNRGLQFVIGPKFEWEEIPVKHINPHLKKVTKYQIGEEGWDYEDNPTIMIFGGKSDFGFLLAITPMILYKQGNWGDWADFVEKYGSPFQIYEYDIYDEQTREKAFELARDAGSNLAIVLPKQLNFRTEDGKQVNGDGKLQGNFSDALDKQITLAILGNLETTSASGGSLAKAKVQHLDQSDVIAMDMKDVLDTLNSDQFLAILESYGYPVKGGEFYYEIVSDPEALKAEVEIDKFLVTEAKLPLGDDYFYQKYRRPKPDNYEELKALQAQKAAQALPPPAVPPAPDPAPPDQNPPKKTASSHLSFWDRIDLRIANFFDRARED